MLIGAHVRDDDPLAAAAERNAEVVQFFLSDPQGWKAPNPHPQAEQLRNSDLAVFIHAPYVVNVASQNNRIRIPSPSRRRRPPRWAPADWWCTAGT